MLSVIQNLYIHVHIYTVGKQILKFVYLCTYMFFYINIYATFF